MGILVLTGPANPLSIRAEGIATILLRPHADQNWRLFAPNPISDERGMLIRAWTSNDPTPTDWFDVTSDAIADSKRAGPLSPRTARIISSGLQMYFQPTPLQVLAVDQSQRRGEPVPEDQELSATEVEYRERALVLLHRFALNRATEHWGNDVQAVQIRLVVHEFPPFSQRSKWSDVGNVSTLDFLPRNTEDLQ